MLTIIEIKSEVGRLANKLGVSGNDLPTFGCTEDGARPHIEVDARGYHYVVVERGEELKRVSTSDLNELLETIFLSVTFDLSVRYELAHRVEEQDCRRIIFQHQIELLSKLSPVWAERESQRHDEILREHPLDDFSSARVTLSQDVGWSKACERHPLPIPSLRPATEDFASLYHRAFSEFGAKALWNMRQIKEPTPADALAITKALRTHGGMDGRRLAERIEELCRAHH